MTDAKLLEDVRGALATLHEYPRHPRDPNDGQSVDEAIAVISHALTAVTEARERAEARTDALETALGEIDSWSRAYPLKVFPEPDFQKAREVLEACGMTLDSISASNMRHAIEGVGKIARAALSTPPNPEPGLTKP